MEWKIPYFEYDVFARIAPGALTIVVAHYLTMPVPEYWKPLLPPGASALDTGVVFFGGLTLLAASYIIGLIYENLLSSLWRCLSTKALIIAAKERTWLRPVAGAVPASHHENKDLFKFLSQWLIHSTDEGVRNGFVHMHRFQAEARLCTYSMLPLPVLLVAGFCKGDYWIGWGSLVMVPLLFLCAWAREKRRWIQALVILDERRTSGDAALAALQEQLEDLSSKATGANKS